MKRLVGLLAAASLFAGISASAQDNTYAYNTYVSSVFIPQIGLCDKQKSYLNHENEDINEYFSGLISAFTLDMDGDGSDELVTVEDDSVNVYGVIDGMVISRGGISQKLITDMGESYANVFVYNSYVGIETYADTGASRKYSMMLFGLNPEATSLTTIAKIEKTISDNGFSEFATGVIGKSAISYSHVQDGDFESVVNNNGYTDINAAATDILSQLGFNSSDLTVYIGRLSFADGGLGNGSYRINAVIQGVPLQTYIKATNIRIGGTPVVIFEDYSRLAELAAEPYKITVTINGNEVVFPDVNPIMISDRTLVPMRKIFEELGCSVEWFENEQKVIASRGGDQISLTIGSNIMTVNGASNEIDVPAQVINDRTLVPARAVSEALKCTVDWDEASKTVTITSN